MRRCFKVMMQSLYTQIDQAQSLKLESRFKHAAHVGIYVRTDEMQFTKYPKHAHVLMQLRFDGTFGFTGGIVDPGETPLIAVNRESCEELGMPEGSINVTESDHIVTHYADELNLCLHYYGKEVDLATFIELENRAVKAKDYGAEVMGVMRIPLYTLPNGLGFPAYLGGQFIGSSKITLLALLRDRKLMPEAEITKALSLSTKLKLAVSSDDIDIV